MNPHHRIQLMQLILRLRYQYPRQSASFGVQILPRQNAMSRHLQSCRRYLSDPRCNQEFRLREVFHLGQPEIRNPAE